MASALSQHANDPMPHRVPNERDWEAAKERIGKWYVDEGLTSQQVRSKLAAERGFDPTERMLKQRFRNWGYARKNTKGIEYEAMRMRFDEIVARTGIQVEFRAPQGRSTRLYSITDINKQLSRPGTKEKREAYRKDIGKVGIDQYLKRKCIEVHYPGLTTEASALNIENPGLDLENTSSTISSSPSLSSDFDDEIDAEGGFSAVIQDPLEPNVILPSHAQFHAQSLEFVKEADLDMPAIFAMFASMKINPPIEAEWAYHVFKTSIKTDENRADSAAGYHRNRARDAFMRMLIHENQHILSSLIHVSCVFSGNGGYDIYRSILRDCLELIDQNRSRNQFYAIPYRYALACEDGNQEAVSELGRQLLDGAEHNGYDSQRLSSNFLVCQQFRAHHLLENMQDAEGARDMLLRCLQESSLCLRSDHSVNVNGLNILARAYERLGQYETAIQCYFDAAQRSQQVFGSRHPYRTMMLRNMALLQVKLGKNADAERNMREVFWSRADLLGPGHEFTFSALQKLQQFLHGHGRGEEAEQLTDAREALYHDDKHWTILSEKDAAVIRRQGRNTGLYWERQQGLAKYKFVMPKEAYMRPDTNMCFKAGSK